MFIFKKKNLKLILLCYDKKNCFPFLNDADSCINFYFICLFIHQFVLICVCCFYVDINKIIKSKFNLIIHVRIYYNNE